MKKKINLHGADWDQATSDARCSLLKNILWVYDGSADTCLYINWHMQDIFTDTSDTKKYIWINESKAIDPISHNLLQERLGEFLIKSEGILTHDKNIYSQFAKGHFVPASNTWIKEPKICDKTKLVSMIASNKRICAGHDLRLQWVDRLRNDLDLYGVGFNPIDSKEQGLCDYMFSVAIENAVYESYFTEKILDCFATGTIPIYIGTPDIGDFFNSDGIIMLDDNFDIRSLTPELYYSKIDAVRDNFERVKEYIYVEDYVSKNYFKEN